MKKIISIAILLIGLSSCGDNKKAENVSENTKSEYLPTNNINMKNQLKIIAEITLKPNAMETMKPVFEKVIAGSQAEEGCIYYDLHKDISDTTDTKYVMIETWKDQAAIDSHNASAHFKTFKQAAADHIADMRVLVVKVAK